jgi:hypothetical protein
MYGVSVVVWDFESQVEDAMKLGEGLLTCRTGAFLVGCGGCFDDATAVSKSWRRRCGSCGILGLRLHCRCVT